VGLEDLELAGEAPKGDSGNEMPLVAKAVTPSAATTTIAPITAAIRTVFFMIHLLAADEVHRRRRRVTARTERG
jgi:hypothetical protein